MRRLPHNIQRVAPRKLLPIDAATLPDTLRVPPGKFLEALKGGRLGRHPGGIPLKDFLKLTGLSQYRLARPLGVPPQRVHDLVHGRRAITADTALRPARTFSMELQFSMNLPSRYGLEVATDTLQARIEAPAGRLAPARDPL